jgi:RIO-like serine/threonine protein kinase
MSEEPGVGVYSSWLKMFEIEFNNLNENQYHLKDIYLSMIPYLAAFSNPVLVHGDISSENILVLNEHLNGVKIC